MDAKRNKGEFLAGKYKDRGNPSTTLPIGAFRTWTSLVPPKPSGNLTLQDGGLGIPNASKSTLEPIHAPEVDCDEEKSLFVGSACIPVF